MASLAIEAKAKEPFGNKTLQEWLSASSSESSKTNRLKRWDFIERHLPTVREGAYSEIRYQILHRCASAVIEAGRFNIGLAAFFVQAFATPEESFEEYSKFCKLLRIDARRNGCGRAQVGEVQLLVGWADCELASDEEVASIA
ncbi:MAG: hypothetical protein ABII12_06815 [Planctomycetota bacterium]